MALKCENKNKLRILVVSDVHGDLKAVHELTTLLMNENQVLLLLSFYYL